MGLIDRFYPERRAARATARHVAMRRRWADPTAIRQWHNPADPIQAARIEAAAAKRANRAHKLFTQASFSADQNRAHEDEFDNLHDRLNPFYVA